MKLQFVFIFLILSTTMLFGQQKKEEVYLLPNQIKKAASYLQSTHWSRIGAYQESMEAHCKGYDELVLDSMDQIQIQNSKVVDAIDYIKKVAKNYQIIIINEEHHSNRQRKFLSTLLPIFKQNGFTHFGAETFDHRYMEELNTTKIPTIHTGYYSVSPVFGELIRTAADNNYLFFAYESQENYTIESPNFSPPQAPVFAGDSMMYQMHQFNYEMNLRSYHQFAHIEKMLLKNPKAKLVIYCGYDHLNETNIYDWTPLAARIKENLKIDPLTIDLTLFSEKCQKDVHPNYLVMRDLNIEIASVLITKDNKVFKPIKYRKDRDIYVFLPPTEEKKYRSHWLFDEEYKACRVKKTKKFRGIVLAYYADENIQTAIPADIIAINDGKRVKPALCLKKGSYRLEYLSKEGDVKKRRLRVK